MYEPNYTDSLRADILPSYSDSLMHHGIRGQKWGVRRFQNPDGSLTPAGKKRYGYLLNDHMKGHERIKTDNGETLELHRQLPSNFTRLISNISPNIKNTTKNSSLWNITSKGKKIGDLQLYREKNNDLNLTWIGINNAHRGKGYAQSVMKNVIDYAKESGTKKVTLEVPGNSPSARHIYEKMGFKVTKTLSDDDVWGGLTAMELSL